MPIRNNQSRYDDMKDGYCENCLNPAECYLSGRCWPVVDYVQDAGKLCAEMDELHAEYRERAQAGQTTEDDEEIFGHGEDSESDCEAAGAADEKPDGQEENTQFIHPYQETPKCTAPVSNEESKP